MKLKKLAALILALAMALSLVACGGSSSSDGNSDGGDGAITSAGADASVLTADDPLTIWAWDTGFNIPAMQAAVDLYIEQNGLEEGSIVIQEQPSSDVETAITTAGQSGDYSQLPDITLLQDHDFQKYLVSYPEIFADLTNIGVDYSQFADYKVSYSTYEGKNYAVPFDSGCVIAAYRTDVLDEAGYTIDDLTDITWDEFNTIGADIYAKTGKHILSEATDSNDTVLFMIQSAGGSMFTDDGEINLTMDNAPLVAALTAYKNMVDSGTMELVSSWDEYIASFASKESTAAIVNGSWILASIQSGNDTQDGTWAMTKMPSLAGVEGATNYSNNGGSSWTVMANSSKAAIAADLLKNTFASEENAADLYKDILTRSTAIGTFTPALEADIYEGTLSKFADEQQIYAEIAEWAASVPTSADSMYYYEARDVLATAQQKYVDGTMSLEDALAEAMTNYATQVG